MILRAISGYLSDHNVVNEYEDSFDNGCGSCVAIFDESRLLTIYIWDGVVVVVSDTDLLRLCSVSDPGMLGKVLGVVRSWRGCAFLEGL
jgi:hypothetical protein